jgi:hypothetical protein
MMIGWIEDTEVPAVVAETRGVVRAVFVGPKEATIMNHSVQVLRNVARRTRSGKERGLLLQ